MSVSALLILSFTEIVLHRSRTFIRCGFFSVERVEGIEPS